MSKVLNLQDAAITRDDLVLSLDASQKTIKTKIMGVYDHYIDDRGRSQFGEVLFETENQTVLGGALFILEKCWGLQSPLAVDYLNNIMGIANTGTPVTDIYPKDNVVCLFGVGIGGAGDSLASVKDVKMQEREIMDMIPIRLTDQPLASSDVDKYWFKKKQSDGKTAYYLKNFESAPTIRVLWKDGQNGEDGTEVETGVHNSTRTEPIETFVEMILKINRSDCREYFTVNGNIEQARVNSIGIFTGVKSTLGDGTIDYKQVKLFAKLNINNEPLNLPKDLTILYRMYTS